MSGALLPLGACTDSRRVGERASRLGRLLRAGIPVPPGFVLPVSAVAAWAASPPPVASSGPPAPEDAAGEEPRQLLAAAVAELEARLQRGFGCGEAPFLLAVRQSPVAAAFGLHSAILQLGAAPGAMAGLARLHGEAQAWHLRGEFLRQYAGAVGNLDPELVDSGMESGPGSERQQVLRLESTIAAAGLVIPDSPLDQLAAAIRRLARPRYGPPAGQALLVQLVGQAMGGSAAGSGRLRSRDPASGRPALAITLRPGWRATEAPAAAPDLPGPVRQELAGLAGRAEAALCQGVELGFVLGGDGAWIVGADPLPLSPAGQAELLVDLVARSILSRQEAVLRIDPLQVEMVLHARVDPEAGGREICRGLAAAPGAAVGELVFSALAAERLANRGGHPVLARTETNPADVGAMHFAEAVITSRGGMTSHAAVVTRALGRPCVAGVAGLHIDAQGRRMRMPGGAWYAEGCRVTVDGSAGRLLAGEVAMLPPEFAGAMARIVEWADGFRRMGVRANADTPADARLALEFRADGIGLCRTEHMFFARGRMAAMHEMILAETEAERRTALDKLLPMQFEDLRALFLTMHGRPVVVRLLDPPLHEFLPRGEREMLELAEAMQMPVDQVMARARALQEFNPMLGNRGCRLGIAFPEIYEMQIRAILLAAAAAGRETGTPALPEIMVPLVSAHREMEILKALIDSVAAEIAAASGVRPDYRVGAMIETPRAALRSDAISDPADFLSYGTNDLTQMAFGLSRDDAGRFMPQYLRQQVYAADPFTSIDREGVGELIGVSVERARRSRPRITLGLCGEHGADPDSLHLCESLGIDYVSCSPFRLPVARLAAAQAALHRAAREDGTEGRPPGE